MTIEELKTNLEKIAPTAYREYAENEAPELPYINFYEDSANTFCADNKVLWISREMSVELYADPRNLEKEAEVEAMLTENKIIFRRYSMYIASESMNETLYEFTMNN